MKRVLLLLLVVQGSHLEAKIEAYGATIQTPQTPLIILKEGETHNFQINSKVKRNPVDIHLQNKDFASVNCRRIKSQAGKHTHKCKLKVEKNPGGSLAVFKRSPKGTNQVLFHVSIEEYDNE